MNPDYLVDFSSWPKEFANDEEALKQYNKLGMLKKIHFKRGACKRDAKGMLLQFVLVCHKKSVAKPKAAHGLKLKESILTGCPVSVRFKWSLSRCAYVRSQRLRMHHNHPLEIVDRHFLQHEALLKDVAVYVQSKLPVGMITSLINAKFKTHVKYDNVYSIVRQLSAAESPAAQASALKHEKDDQEVFYDLLQEMKER